MRETRVRASVFETGLGWAAVAVGEKGLARVVLPKPDRASAERELRTDWPAAVWVDAATLGEYVSEIVEYSRGQRNGFDLPVDLSSGTLFQRLVWETLLSIPRGETRSYTWVAERVGRPRACRAVGQAVGANPVPIVVPCHRVLRSDGSLGGFGGGLELKRRLLELEQRS